MRRGDDGRGGENGVDEGRIAAFAAFAVELAARARRVTLATRSDGAGEDKGTDGAFDPVTEADRGAERAMRALIAERYPDHGVIGEEYGAERGDARFVWSLDPIDGTRAFVCGLPGWTTLIALMAEGQPLLGLVDAPRLDELYLGFSAMARLRRGGEESVLATSGCARLDEARLATTDPFLFAGEEAEAFARLRGAARLTRYGFDGYAYARLAAGSIDLVAESGLRTYDWAALVPLIRAAGGTVGNWRGESDFSDGQILAAATPELFEAAVAALAMT